MKVDVISNILGSGLVLLKLEDSSEGKISILECRVRTVSFKCKVVEKPKLIGCRFPEEAAFLDDLVSWLTTSYTAVPVIGTRHSGSVSATVK
jgi:hypothetical protein